MPETIAYNEAKELPHELREYCVFSFEEQLYSQALTLLSNVLASPPLALQRPSNKVVIVPQPDILSLIANLIVNPALTTRATTADKVAASNEALRFLRHVNKSAGPVNAHFDTAFIFLNRSWRLGRESAAEAAQKGDGLNLDKFRDGSIWKRAEDFWHVVGWALNCAVHHVKRWERWELWLAFLLEVLEDDFQERSRLLETGNSKASGAAKSLIVQYLAGPGSSIRRARRTFRAIMSRGDSESVAEFKEVFRNETAERKPEERTKSRPVRKINIEEGDFGDYFDDEEEEFVPSHPVDAVLAELTNTGRQPSGRNKTGEAPSSSMPEVLSDPVSSGMDSQQAGSGPMKNLAIRLRLLVLLSKASAAAPDDFIQLDDFYELACDFLKTLEIRAFMYLVSPHSEPLTFPPAIHASLNQRILDSLISKKGRVRYETINQARLESFYLPLPAVSGTAEDNLKVSLLLEALLRLVRDNLSLERSQPLEDAVERGISARCKSQTDTSGSERAAGAGGGDDASLREDSDEASDRSFGVGEALELSAARLRLLVKTGSSNGTAPEIRAADSTAALASRNTG